MSSDPNANYVNPPHIEIFLATLDDTAHDQNRQPIQDHFAEVSDLEQKKRYWDTRSDSTASDAEVKVTRLAPIQKRLAELADERKLLRGDVLEAPRQVRQLVELPPLEWDNTESLLLSQNNAGTAAGTVFIGAGACSTEPVSSIKDGVALGSSRAVKLPDELPHERNERRWQMCVNEGLVMPDNDYKHLPRGIGVLATRESISQQAFSKSVKKHIASKR